MKAVIEYLQRGIKDISLRCLTNKRRKDDILVSHFYESLIESHVADLWKEFVVKVQQDNVGALDDNYYGLVEKLSLAEEYYIKEDLIQLSHYLDLVLKELRTIHNNNFLY